MGTPARLLPALLLAFSLAPVTAAAQIEEPRIPLQTKVSELNRFRVEYAENWNKKNVAAIVAMWSPDAIFIDADGTTYEGSAAVNKWYTDRAADMPHLVLESDSLSVYGNTAVDMGTSKMHPSAGGEMVARYLVVLRRDMNGWKLVRAAITPVGSM
jgi:ketosteroid isomerase-like protein